MGRVLQLEEVDFKLAPSLHLALSLVDSLLEPSCLRKYGPSLSFDPGLLMDFNSSLGWLVFVPS